MKIERVDLADYRIPFTRPYRAGGLDIRERRGLIVRLQSEDGLQGFGEIAPLPGLHRESLSEVRSALAALTPALEGMTAGTFRGLGDAIASLVDTDMPSLCFGLQSAAAGLFARHADSTPAAVLGDTPRAEVPLGGLFQGDLSDAHAALADDVFVNFRSVKVKVGQRSSRDDRALLDVLLEGLDPRTRLRLDANRALSLAKAVERFDGLPPERIEYLEEPLADPAQSSALSAQTGLGIALDESLHEPALQALRYADGVSAWVVKPSRVGRWALMEALAKDATQHGIGLVLSSCLESGLGLWAQVQMAAALPGAGGPAGLATEAWLTADLVAPPFDSSAGCMSTSDWPRHPTDALSFSRAR